MIPAFTAINCLYATGGAISRLRIQRYPLHHQPFNKQLRAGIAVTHIPAPHSPVAMQFF